MSTTFGNSLERPCVDCGGHPLRAVHDRNGAGFTHYYVAPVEHEQPASESEWYSVNMTDTAFDNQPVITIEQGDKLLATAHSPEAAKIILRNHRLAALVPGLVEALEKCQTYLKHHSHEQRGVYGSLLDVVDTALNAVAKEWKE